MIRSMATLPPPRPALAVDQTVVRSYSGRPVARGEAATPVACRLNLIDFGRLFGRVGVLADGQGRSDRKCATCYSSMSRQPGRPPHTARREAQRFETFSALIQSRASAPPVVEDI